MLEHAHSQQPIKTDHSVQPRTRISILTHFSLTLWTGWKSPKKRFFVFSLLMLVIRGHEGEGSKDTSSVKSSLNRPTVTYRWLGKIDLSAHNYSFAMTQTTMLMSVMKATWCRKTHASSTARPSIFCYPPYTDFSGFVPLLDFNKGNEHLYCIAVFGNGLSTVCVEPGLSNGYWSTN